MSTHIKMNGRQHYLTPTQYLALEVLTARWRCGERMWPFPNAVKSALDGLAALGIVGHKGGVVSNTRQAWLTDLGVALATSRTYKPPVAPECKRRHCCAA